MISISILAATDCTAKTFMGLVPWYKYITLKDDGSGGCTPVFSDLKNVWSDAVLPIGLAVVDDLLRIAAMVSVGYIIYGGFRYMTGQGSPDSIQEAQTIIKNAIVGLVIALISVGVVTFLGQKLG